jgi:hypothetical protein
MSSAITLPGFQGPKNLIQWLNTALAGVDKVKLDGSPASCIGFSLVHVAGTVAGGGIEKEIHAVNIGGKKFDDAAVSQLAETLYGTAQTDAQNLTGSQQYIIYAIYEEQGAGPPKARYPLRINGHIVNSPGDVSTEAPTEEGRRMQRMRHDEGYSQMLTVGLANLINQQNAFITIQNQALIEKTRENINLMEATNRLLVERVTMDREHELKVLTAQRNQALIEGAVKLAPALMNQITGREIVPQATADTAIIEAVAEALSDPETMQQALPLVAKLPAAAQGVLMSRLQQVAEAKKTAEDRVRNALGKMDPIKLTQAEIEDVSKH